MTRENHYESISEIETAVAAMVTLNTFIERYVNQRDLNGNIGLGEAYTPDDWAAIQENLRESYEIVYCYTFGLSKFPDDLNSSFIIHSLSTRLATYCFDRYKYGDEIIHSGVSFIYTSAGYPLADKQPALSISIEKILEPGANDGTHTFSPSFQIISPSSSPDTTEDSYADACQSRLDNLAIEASNITQDYNVLCTILNDIGSSEVDASRTRENLLKAYSRVIQFIFGVDTSASSDEDITRLVSELGCFSRVRTAAYVEWLSRSKPYRGRSISQRQRDIRQHAEENPIPPLDFVFYSSPVNCPEVPEGDNRPLTVQFGPNEDGRIVPLAIDSTHEIDQLNDDVRAVKSYNNAVGRLNALKRIRL